ILWAKMDERMRDSAFATNIDQTWHRAVGGYYGGPNAFNVWSSEDWKRFRPNRKLPIWVAGLNGHDEGQHAVSALQARGVPRRLYGAVDRENGGDKTYLEPFGETLQGAGYKISVHGSAWSVSSNPRLNGYWVADFAGKGPFM